MRAALPGEWPHHDPSPWGSSPIGRKEVYPLEVVGFLLLRAICWMSGLGMSEGAEQWSSLISSFPEAVQLLALRESKHLAVVRGLHPA